MVKIITPNTSSSGGYIFNQLNADWNATSGTAEILNKPTSLPANGGNADTIGGKGINDIELKNQIYTFDKNINVDIADSWVETGIYGSQLPTGTYILQASSNSTSLGQWYINYSGVVGWYGSGTNSNGNSEIPINNSGHSNTTTQIKFRTSLRNKASDIPYCHLEINTGKVGNFHIVFKFKRMI